MNKISQGTQNIKRLVLANIAHNQATGIRRVLGVVFNDFAFSDCLLNFTKRNIPAITSPLSVPGDLVFSLIEFLLNFFKHIRRVYHKKLGMSSVPEMLHATRYTLHATRFIPLLSALLLLLATASITFAATESVSTIKESGGGGDYTTLTTWEAATKCDLTGADRKVFSVTGVVVEIGG